MDIEVQEQLLSDDVKLCEQRYVIAKPTLDKRSSSITQISLNPEQAAKQCARVAACAGCKLTRVTGPGAVR